MPPEAWVPSKRNPVWKEAGHDDFSHPAGDANAPSRSARPGRPTARACAISTGADYEEAERISWARLQGTLRELSAAATAN